MTLPTTDLSNKKVKITNSTAKDIGFYPYKSNFVVYLAAGASLTFIPSSPEAALHYFNVAKTGLEVSVIA